MSKIIAITNQKGGCGKTTTSIEVIDYLSSVLNKKVLAIDFDPQATLSKTFVPADKIKQYQVFDFIGTHRNQGIQLSPYVVNENLSFFTATERLSSLNKETDLDAPLYLAQALESFADIFDYIVIDSPPEISQLTHNIFSAANQLIIPVYPGRYSVEGLVTLRNQFNQIKRMYNPSLEIGGILLTNIDKNTKAERSINELVKECCSILDTKKYDATIYHATAVNDAQLEYKPLRVYNKQSKVYQNYLSFCRQAFGGDTHESKC